MSPIQRSWFGNLMGCWSLALSPSFVISQHLMRTFSPYELNPFDINPLRDIVADFFDFGIINNATAPKLVAPHCSTEYPYCSCCRTLMGFGA